MPVAWQEGGGGRKALLARLLTPFARRDAEPLLEDTAEMREVVKAPREGDLADMPGLVRWVAKVALAALQPLRLDVAAERGEIPVAAAARGSDNSGSARCVRI